MINHPTFTIKAQSTSLLFLTLFVGSLLSTGCTQHQTNNRTMDEDDAKVMQAYIGTYTRDEGWVNGKADGIYHVTIEDTTTHVQLLTKAVNPSYLALSENGHHLYAVSELGRDDEEGVLLFMEMLDDGRWTQTGRYLTGGRSPAHVSIHPSGNRVYVTNYSGGVLKTFQRGDSGLLRADQEFTHSGNGPHPNQNASHLHMALPSADGKFLYVTDLGADRIWIYRTRSFGRLEPRPDSLVLQPGSGPRHMALHPDKPLAFILNELSSTVSTARVDRETGSLDVIDTIRTLPESYEGWNSTAAIHLHPDGKRLFVSNRGHNSVASFTIDAETGTLQLVDLISSGGEMPRDFRITPDGNSLLIANQNSDNLVMYDLNGDEAADPAIIEISVPTPVSILFTDQ